MKAVADLLVATVSSSALFTCQKRRPEKNNVRNILGSYLNRTGKVPYLFFVIAIETEYTYINNEKKKERRFTYYKFTTTRNVKDK